jgi:hypothetical protein
MAAEQPEDHRLEFLRDGGDVELVAGPRDPAQPQPLEAVLI